MIPKIIHYIWIGNSKKPKNFSRILNSWKVYCPDYKIIEWNEKNYNFNKNNYMIDAIRNKKYALASDYARLDILYNNGGIYLDTDFELLKNLDPLLVHNAFTGFGDNNSLAVGIIGAEKSNSDLQNILMLFKDEKIYSNNRLNETIISKFNRYFFLERGIKLLNGNYNILSFYIAPRTYFYPIPYLEYKTHFSEHTYAIHLWDGTWLSPRKKFKIKIYKFLKYLKSIIYKR
jgi:hypothetical protein